MGSLFSSEEIKKIQEQVQIRNLAEKEVIKQREQTLLNIQARRKIVFEELIQTAREYPKIAAQCGVPPKRYPLAREHWWQPSETRPLFALEIGIRDMRYDSHQHYQIHTGFLYASERGGLFHICGNGRGTGHIIRPFQIKVENICLSGELANFNVEQHFRRLLIKQAGVL